MSQKIQYVCPKCGCNSFEQGQIQTTGGNFSKIFNVQNNKFITVSCSKCGYTELFRSQTSTGMNILDFLMNN
ncbi:MAG: zinc ribbon domain-containing protein [Eubacteriales bacterium]|nr:zinc ribbon domain-containing protein [Eubacteriales bacterium]MDD3882240.1 zinc ribbon domain-containing protein [Eubacteriales bacterium]MDD4512589.1 zinc ribbon domain-containing protein [Eubacteriales bacterium]